VTRYPLSRRAFVGSTLAAAAATAGFAVFTPSAAAAAGARLTARPRKPTKSIDPGLQSLKLSDGARDALIYVPRSYDARTAAPLLLALHGATQAGQLMATRLQPIAGALGAPLLAPDSRAMTWDGIQGDFGVDTAFIDRALTWTFDRCNIDASRIWLSGFSDGASYGLALALANGDFTGRMLAFSPGFIPPTRDAQRSVRKPRIYVSHGTNDPILPIERCSRIIVPELKRDGYTVRFDEFDGGHRMPPEILAAATTWLKTP
jgi:phospholipase/carboxylesterase